MKDLNLIQIIQRIKGEDFEWWLLQLNDGRLQALWFEPISGALNRTFVETSEELDDLDDLGRHAFAMRRERIATIDDVEYQLLNRCGDSNTQVHWLDADSGQVRKARIHPEWSVLAYIENDEILNAVNTPDCWID